MAISADGETGSLNLQTDTYTRFAYVEIDGINTPLSDNFIDIEGGKTINLTFALPKGVNAADLQDNVHILSMADVDFSGTLLQDKLWRLKTRFTWHNMVYWFVFKFLI